MSDLAWHRKYHPGRVCDFSDAVDYNAYMLNAIERQIDVPDSDRERQKTAYRRRYALNEYEFELLSSGVCPTDETGFEELEETVETPRAFRGEDLFIPTEAKKEKKRKTELSPRKKKELRGRWVRRAVLGGLAISTLAIAGALGYWAFKPRRKRTPSPGMVS